MTTLKLELTDDAYARLEKKAKEQGMSVTELVRRALNLEAAVQDRKVYVEGSEQGQLRELLLA
jgi:hypothetical protein